MAELLKILETVLLETDASERPTSFNPCSCKIGHNIPTLPGFAIPTYAPNSRIAILSNSSLKGMTDNNSGSLGS
jgi:hypothetical protein